MDFKQWKSETVSRERQWLECLLLLTKIRVHTTNEHNCYTDWVITKQNKQLSMFIPSVTDFAQFNSAISNHSCDATNIIEWFNLWNSGPVQDNDNGYPMAGNGQEVPLPDILLAEKWRHLEFHWEAWQTRGQTGTKFENYLKRDLKRRLLNSYSLSKLHCSWESWLALLVVLPTSQMIQRRNGQRNNSKLLQNLCCFILQATVGQRTSTKNSGSALANS